MKSPVLFAAALCTIASACNSPDTERPVLWGRTTEARLSEATEYAPCTLRSDEKRILPLMQCSADDIETDGVCAPIMNVEEAVETLALRPACLDYAVTALEQYRAWTDLSAAYIARARRDDNAVDYLKAVYAASKSVETASENAAALFNLALARQNVGLTGEAIATWNRYLKVDAASGWAEEARAHLKRLKNQGDGVEQWAAIQKQLENATDEAAFAQLIKRFPSSAMVYFERLNPRPIAFATALSKRLHNDPWPLALVQDGAARELLDRYHDSIENRAPAVLEAVAAEAQSRGYKHLLARCRVVRALFRYDKSRYLEALTELDAAHSDYKAMGDEEGVAIAQMRRIGYVRDVGGAEHAWREAFRAFPDVAHIGAARQRHFLHGEIAQTAMELGHPDIALRHQNLGIHVLQDMDLKRDRAVALRERARIEVRRGHYDAAIADLSASEELLNTVLPADRRILRAAQAEVRGHASSTSPAAAIAHFTEALHVTRVGEFPTFRATLYAKRAEAYYRLHQPENARADLEQALDVLDREERRLLQETDREDAEEFWSSYFSRFQEAYELLIHLLMQQGEKELAFLHAERARAYEPLYRVLQSGSVPPAFAKFVASGPRVADLQRELPAGTYIFQYAVQKERTYAWIISQDTFDAVELGNATRDFVAARANVLVQAAQRQDIAAFGTALYEPYVRLIAPVLAKTRNPKRIVFVADGAMLGLPFAALRDPITQRYLVEEEVTIAISPSAALYIWSLFRNREMQPAEPMRVFLLGNPSFEPIPSLPSLRLLPGAESEVKRIAEIYGPGADPLVGNQATVAALLSHGPRSAIIHMAAHAIANPRVPNQSVLLLAKAAGHNGQFTAKECMAQLNLPHTRLVVLSTCSSASGISVGPEGMAPLVRPLFAAGVPAVIGSLWDVEDATAEELLVSFHRAHRQGKDAAAAMQEAQRALLNHKTNSRFRPALAWASFQVTGYASPPFPPSRQKQ